MRILVVDDEPALGLLLSRVLAKYGHEAEVAVHPSDALAMLNHGIEAVITDIEMPDQNGVELARAIRELEPEMPIAFCTGSDPGGEVAAEAARIGPVLPKVWTLDRVRALVDDHLAPTRPRS